MRTALILSLLPRACKPSSCTRRQAQLIRRDFASGRRRHRHRVHNSGSGRLRRQREAALQEEGIDGGTQQAAGIGWRPLVFFFVAPLLGWGFLVAVRPELRKSLQQEIQSVQSLFSGTRTVGLETEDTRESMQQRNQESKKE